jgi:predicted DNA binding CopG/RHH family protein
MKKELTAHQRALQKYHAKLKETHVNIRITRVLRDHIKAKAHAQSLTMEKYLTDISKD